jgi:leucyl aminopeptidase
MNFHTSAASASDISGIAADALMVVLLAEAESAGAGPTGLVDKPLLAAVAAMVKQGDLLLKAGRTLCLQGLDDVKAPRVVFSVAKDGSAKAFRSALTAGLQALKGRSVKHLAVASVAPLSEAHAEALALAVGDAVYVYRHTKPSAEPAPALAKVTLVCEKPQTALLRRGLARGEAIGEGVTLARECANRPGNHCTPSYLADVAQEIGKTYGMAVKVLDRKAVEKLGMGAFLAVAQGSEEPLRFIVVEYRGGDKSDAPLVLVGKGITFDTGGISLKPAAEMDEMKFDMGGAASVLGTLRAVGQLKPAVNLVGIIPSCDNMPSGRAVKPGDVVTSMSGKTIEILNTDAEGRLILCDALTYAERFKPAAVVDMATLTGACVIALGHHHSGLFSADDGLAGELLQASSAALDPCWRMPLDEEYDDALKSNFADMANVGPRAGGSITAAKFLQRFTSSYPWAHLDIAGTAWKSGAAKGATGRPVGLLTHFVLARSDKTVAAKA